MKWQVFGTDAAGNTTDAIVDAATVEAARELASRSMIPGIVRPAPVEPVPPPQPNSPYALLLKTASSVIVLGRVGFCLGLVSILITLAVAISTSTGSASLAILFGFGGIGLIAGGVALELAGRSALALRDIAVHVQKRENGL